MSLLKYALGLSFIVMASTTISCSSCSKPDKVPPKPAPTVVNSIVPPVPTTQLIELDKASVVVSLKFSEVSDENSKPNYRLFANRTDTELISLDVENYEHSYEEFVLEGIRFLKEQNATVHSAVKVNLNDQDMVLVESSKEGIHVWSWATTKNGKGFTLSCGGLETSLTTEGMCLDMARSFKIQ